MVDLLESLSVFNKFKFKEDTHEYFCGEKKISTSVTRFIEKYEHEFEREKWGRIIAKRKGKTLKEVLGEWDSKARISQVLGTALHAKMELLFNNKIYVLRPEDVARECQSDDEFNKIMSTYEKMSPILDQYYKDASGVLLPVRLEMVIGDEDLDIAGCVDGLFWNKKWDQFQIYDYKSNENFKVENAEKSLLPPFDDLQECQLTEYSLQLSIYKYIIEKHTGIKIGDCFLVHFDRNEIKYRFYKALDLTSRLEDVFCTL